jgi:hypothetical protein
MTGRNFLEERAGGRRKNVGAPTFLEWAMRRDERPPFEVRELALVFADYLAGQIDRAEAV